MILQRSQLLAVPLSGALCGLLNALPYAPMLGWPGVLAAGSVLGLLLLALGAWMSWRSDGGPRYYIAGAALFVLSMGLLLAGGSLVLAQMLGAERWAGLAWAGGLLTVCGPVLGTAWPAYSRCRQQASVGQWSRQPIEQRYGLLLPSAQAAGAAPVFRVTPWLVAALAVNVPLLIKGLGGGDALVLVLGLLGLALGLVWVAVRQVGPALGAAWYLLGLEREQGRRLRHPQWAQLQALRRGHWLARWFMGES